MTNTLRQGRLIQIEAKPFEIIGYTQEFSETTILKQSKTLVIPFLFKVQKG